MSNSVSDAVLELVMRDYRDSMRYPDARVTQSETLGTYSFDLTHDKRNRLITAAREAYETNPIAHQVINSLVDFVIGPGLMVTARDKDEEAQAVIDDFRARNAMDDRDPEIVRRVLIDGAVYIRKIETPLGYVIREYSPLALASDGGPGAPPGWDSGVVTDSNDIERVKKYLFDANGDGKIKAFKPEEIEAIKYNADSDMLHGRSYLSSLLARLSQYSQWVDQRVILNRLKSAVYMITTIEGDSSAISTIDGDIVKSTRSGQSQAAKMPPAGSRLLATKGVKHEIVQANVNAEDVKDDGLRMLRDVAVGAGLAEWIVTGDSSSTNRASSETSESQMVRRVQRLRRTPFGAALARIYCAELELQVKRGNISPKTSRRVLTPQAKAVMDQAEMERLEGKGDNRRDKRARSTIEEVKANPKSYETIEVERTCQVELMWPEIIPREQKETAEAMAILKDHSVISRQTFAATMGFDYKREAERIEDEQATRQLAEGAPGADEPTDDMDEASDAVTGAGDK